MEKNRAEDSSSSGMLSTVEQIHKRLIRPTNSQSISTFFTSSHHPTNPICKSTSSSYNLQKIQQIESIKLEDYLDPVLLSAVRAQIGGKRKLIHGEEKINAGYSNEFDKFEQWRVMRETKFDKNEAVDLNNDSDDSIGIGDGEDDGVFCTPFMQFEKTASKLLEG